MRPIHRRAIALAALLGLAGCASTGGGREFWEGVGQVALAVLYFTAWVCIEVAIACCGGRRC